MCFRKNKTDNLKDNRQEQINKLNLTAKEKYEYVIKARNFHYREFNVWSTYFSVIVGALFVAYHHLLEGHPLLAFVVSALGFIASLCWYLSAKGYTYWWHHWSAFLIHMEKDDIKSLEACGVYSSFFDENEGEKQKSSHTNGNKNTFYSAQILNPFKGSNVSTSKVMMFLTFCTTVAWAVVCIGSLINIMAESTWEQISYGWLVFLIIVICVGVAIGLYKLYTHIESDMDNHIKPELKTKKDICQST
jgi:hypothetical protein